MSNNLGEGTLVLFVKVPNVYIEACIMKKSKVQRSSKVLANRDFISLLGRSRTKRQQKQLIQFASRDQIHSLLEIILNFKKNRIKLSKIQKKKLERYQKAFDILLKTKQLSQQKKILDRKGTGFLPILLPSLVGALAGLLKK